MRQQPQKEHFMLKKRLFGIMTFIVGVMLVLSFTACDDSSGSDSVLNTDPKTMKISFVGNGGMVIGGATYTLLVGKIEDDDWVTIAFAESPFETGFSQNVFTFELFEANTTTPWTGNGSYYLQLRVEGSGDGWFYTAGRNIPPETNITTYNINKGVTTINIDQFRQM